jgi:hypothetical protein
VAQAAVRESPAAGVVERRVQVLRELAQSDPAAAADQAWAWFVEAGKRFHDDRDGAGEELAALFRAGTPSREIDGPTQGALITLTVHPALDRGTAAITTLWLPWLGKRFDAAAQRGENLLRRSARWPSKALWPRYRMNDAPQGLAAFDFEMRVEAGKDDPDREVLVIDYAPIERNPSFVIRSIRDELVEIVPGAHLGKVLWRHRDGDRYRLLGYFALRSPAGD